MLFGRKKIKEAVASIEQREAGETYWYLVKKQFKKNRTAVWATRVLLFLVFVALTADFLANEKPVNCKIEGKSYWLVFSDYAKDEQLTTWKGQQRGKKWSERTYDYAIFPLITYSPEKSDTRNARMGPGQAKNVPSNRFQHWLGTDQLGRDVAAIMIHGTRVAMLVGLIAMSVAAMIGILLGGLAGYFGDYRLKISRGRLILNGIGLFLALYYVVLMPGAPFSSGREIWGILLFLLIMLGANGLAFLLKQIPFFRKPVTIWIDFMVMRLIEVVNSIPGLLLILAVLPIIKDAGIFHVMIIIGFIFWTGIARFIRGELLRVRSLEYVEAAKALGFSEWRIMFKHAIPNALTPVLITLAFGMASAVLLEAFISFLGVDIKLSGSEITWGGLLSIARGQPSNWWLAIFPGLSIFVTVLIFNLIGEGLLEALNPKQVS